MLPLDASYGEGGGQVLRVALALAVALGRPVTLTNIRVRRPRPGLQPQHLTAVRALAAISAAEVRGDQLDSTSLTFVPGTPVAGTYRFDVGATRGSAGSVSLILQTLLLPLALTGAPSAITLVGGTHVPWSPTVHYLTEVFLPALAPAGVTAAISLRRWGWYPAGGGEIEATIHPVPGLRGLVIDASPAGDEVVGLSAVSRLPRSIAERQRHQAEERLRAAGLRAAIAVEEDQRALGPGTVLFLAFRGRAGFSALGRRGLPAERVADLAVDELLAWIASGAAVDEHLADQLVPFLALGRSASTFTCPRLSTHLQTVVWLLRHFVGARIALDEGPPARVRIEPGAASTPFRDRRPPV
jgi:RNA 3'-terminal phosphate cyclase (ATP)